MNPLFQATHIWLDAATGQEVQASVCLRWQDVRSLEHDVNSGPDSWKHKGPITFLITAHKPYHVLGGYDTWLGMWHRYQASTLALLLCHN